MAGHNPWIDLGICAAFMLLMIIGIVIEAKYLAHKKSKLRGATRC